MSTIYDKMTRLANAIRSKTQKTGKLTLDDMAADVEGIMVGYDTADATAVASNLLEGTTAYNSAGKFTGAMLNRSIVGRNGVIGHSNEYPNAAINIGIRHGINTNLDGEKRLIICAPEGYYNNDAYVGISVENLGNAAANQVLSGATFTSSAGMRISGTMATATQATPSVSVSSSGLITASATQTAGYVSAGTKSGTKQLTTQAAKTVTPSASAQTAVASGVYTTGAVTVAAIPSTYKQVQTTSGTLSSKSSSSGTTIDCGFKPDFVTITENRTYYDDDIKKTFNCDLTFNFINGTDNVTGAEWTSGDLLYEVFARRTDSGFTVSFWKYNSSMTNASWWGNKTFTYYAYKIT